MNEEDISVYKKMSDRREGESHQHKICAINNKVFVDDFLNDNVN